MKEVIRKLLQKIIDDIDSGNSSMTEDEETEIISLLRRYTRRDVRMSKYQAYSYLGIRRSRFDELVRNGQLPEGKKIEGFKELCWFRKDLDRYRNNIVNAYKG